jgi:DNA-binding MarR family transcriptional regulator
MNTKKHPVSQQNIDQFYAINEELRELTAHSETEFFSQFKDISILQAHIILSINYHRPCKMSQIAKSANLTLGSITQIVDKLETKKYVKRVRSKTDRRVVYVELTAKGRKVVTANESHAKQVGHEIMAKFTPEEQTLFLNFFKRMAE